MPETKPFSQKRPWGEFRQFTSHEPVTVKTILVKEGESLSLQFHHARTEFWRILSGTPEVTVGDVVVKAKPGDEFTVPTETNHRIQAIGSDAELLEISRGIFEEDDIVRIEDKYGRAQNSKN